jgi:hypothetical protein
VNENIIGLLCYVGGWVTGLIFFLIDKRPFVRFHAAQSIVTFGGVNLAYIILTNILVTGFRTAGLGFFFFQQTAIQRPESGRDGALDRFDGESLSRGAVPRSFDETLRTSLDFLADTRNSLGLGAPGAQKSGAETRVRRPAGLRPG